MNRYDRIALWTLWLAVIGFKIIEWVVEHLKRVL